MGRYWYLVVLIATGVLTPSLGHSKECPSNKDVAPGVRMPESAGCVPPRREPLRQTKSPSRAAPEPGFIDVGNGLQIRIGGQVDFEAGSRRR